jgi:transcriptional regulator with XRE-family HTH domain
MDRQEIDPKEFGRRVKERRQELKMSQAALAEKSGQSQSNIGWIEQGNAKKPSKRAGERETGLRLMTDQEIVEIYRGLALEERERVSETFSKLLKDNKKKRKVG